MKTRQSAAFGSGQALFLTEQLIVIFFFAVCASICVSIFADAYLKAMSSRDTDNALLAAESAAECFKAAGGDAASVAETFSGIQNNGVLKIYYDDGWKACEEGSGVYVLVMEFRDGDGAYASLVFCDIVVERTSGECLVGFTAAARRTVSGGAG